MLREIGYDREAAVKYAKRMAYERNPDYYNFDSLGGDCTNFASQCIYAGSGVMNYTPVFGWYYKSLNDRTPSWTGVQYLYDFLVSNLDEGPYGAEISRDGVQPGDIVQLGNGEGRCYHTPVIVAVRKREIYVAAHTFNAYMRRLDDYIYDKVRFVHILGVRKKI